MRNGIFHDKFICNVVWKNLSVFEGWKVWDGTYWKLYFQHVLGCRDDADNGIVQFCEPCVPYISWNIIYLLHLNIA